MEAQSRAKRSVPVRLVEVVALAMVVGCAGEMNDGDEVPGRRLQLTPPSVCVAEEGEPDSSADEPRPLLAGSTLTGRACPDETDFFSLATPAAGGALLEVRLEQRQGLGELEATVAGPRTGSRFPGQSPPGAQRRSVSFVATGGSYVLAVDVVSDLPREFAPGRAYAVSLQQLPRSPSDCCSSSEGPGCADDDVLTCLCQLDNACCRGPYDSTCLAEAQSNCNLRCDPPLSQQDCCTASGFAGCRTPEVEECVCSIDPYCCAGGFDDNCVNLASFRCGADCPNLPESSP